VYLISIEVSFVYHIKSDVAFFSHIVFEVSFVYRIEIEVAFFNIWTVWLLLCIIFRVRLIFRTVLIVMFLVYLL